MTPRCGLGRAVWGGWACWKVGFGEQTSSRPDVGTPTPAVVCSLSAVVMEDLQTADLGSYGASGSSRLATAEQSVVLRRLDGVRLVVLLKVLQRLRGLQGTVALSGLAVTVRLSKTALSISV